MSRLNLVSALWLTIGCLLGCSPRHPVPQESVSWPGTNIFETILSRSDIAVKVSAAEQDLPSDKWTSHDKGGKPYNATRSEREGLVASEVLDEIKPHLKTMTTRDLFFSLKTQNYFLEGPAWGIKGVRHNLFLFGNRDIIDELSRRRPHYLKQLSDLKFPHREVWTGDDGPPSSVDDVIPGILSQIKPVSRW